MASGPLPPEFYGGHERPPDEPPYTIQKLRIQDQATSPATAMTRDGAIRLLAEHDSPQDPETAEWVIQQTGQMLYVVSGGDELVAAATAAYSILEEHADRVHVLDFWGPTEGDTAPSVQLLKAIEADMLKAGRFRVFLRPGTANREFFEGQGYKNVETDPIHMTKVATPDEVGPS